MTIESIKLASRVKYWRNVLAIEKIWEIDVNVVKLAKDMPPGNIDSAGCCLTDSSYFQATIHFCEENISSLAELECTVIHELLHIVLHPLELAARSSMTPSHEEVSDMLIESTIERLSRAFVTAYKARP